MKEKIEKKEVEQQPARKKGMDIFPQDPKAPLTQTVEDAPKPREEQAP